MDYQSALAGEDASSGCCDR